MGRRDREHRERVIAGLEAPYRVPTVYAQRYVCGTCHHTLVEYQIEDHECFKKNARCQAVDLATVVKPGAPPALCGKKALYFRQGMALCGECAARLAGAENRPASGNRAIEIGANAPSEEQRVGQMPAPP